MTLVQMQPRSANATPVHRTAADAMLVCDNDGLCTGLVTQAQLAAVRDSSAYTDRVQLRDILGDRRPFTSPVTSMAEAEHAMRCRRLDALPVVDEQGSALGVLALAG